MVGGLVSPERRFPDGQYNTASSSSACNSGSIARKFRKNPVYKSFGPAVIQWARRKKGCVDHSLQSSVKDDRIDIF